MKRQNSEQVYAAFAYMRRCRLMGEAARRVKVLNDNDAKRSPQGCPFLGAAKDKGVYV